MLSASISCCEASSLALKALAFCRSQKGVPQLQQDLLEPSSWDTHIHTLMMMLKLLSGLQQPLVYFLLALYCYNQIYLFWKQAEELGIERKAIINNSNKPFWWLEELPIISLHCAPVQITFLQNVPLCDNGATAPSFLAVDSARSLICFSSFMAINIFNAFWTFCTLKFPINKGFVLIISLSILHAREENMSLVCHISQVSGSELVTWHALFLWSTKLEKLVGKRFDALSLWK